MKARRYEHKNTTFTTAHSTTHNSSFTARRMQRKQLSFLTKNTSILAPCPLVIPPYVTKVNKYISSITDQMNEAHRFRNCTAVKTTRTIKSKLTSSAFQASSIDAFCSALTNWASSAIVALTTNVITSSQNQKLSFLKRKYPIMPRYHLPKKYPTIQTTVQFMYTNNPNQTISNPLTNLLYHNGYFNVTILNRQIVLSNDSKLLLHATRRLSAFLMDISSCMCGNSIYLLLVNILPFPTCATAGSQ